MLFRSSLAFAATYTNFSQTYLPTNIVIRWMRQPGHLRYAWPLSIGLYFGYYGMARWIDSLPATETSGWLALALVIACIDAVKFACAAMVWPLIGAYRGSRRAKRAVEDRHDAWRTGRAREL